MKLALGTVQFGLNYGVLNKEGKTSEKEVKSILDYAKNSSIRVLDTSPAYGNSEKILGELEAHQFLINSKTICIGQDTITNKDVLEVERAFYQSIKNLGVKSINGLFVHNAKDLMKPGKDRLIEKLVEFKKLGFVKNIGVSVYDIYEIEQLYAEDTFDIIQIPINVLDQRLINGDILKYLKEYSVEIYARSIFLQGILLSDEQSLSSKFKDITPTLKDYYSCLKQKGMSKIEGALNFIDSIQEIDYAIVGVNNLNHLQQINMAYQKVVKNNLEMEYDLFAIKSCDIIDPRKW